MAFLAHCHNAQFEDASLPFLVQCYNLRNPSFFSPGMGLSFAQHTNPA